MSSFDDEPEGSGLSRAEIETLCVLHVVGARGCPVLHLAERLGLSPSVAEEVAEGMRPLVMAGVLDRSPEDMFTVTDAGRERLELTFERLGLRSPWSA